MDSDENRKNTNEGNWNLIKLGTYSYISGSITSANLDGIVDKVHGAYNDVSAPLDKDSIIIHELKDGDDHIAYGVVIAYDSTKGYVGFIGDTWSASNGGAFYLLSQSAISFPVIITASVNATDYARSLSISLDTSGTHDFGRVNWDYSTPPCKEVTVLNNGNGATGDLTVALSGVGADSFEFLSLTDGKITSIGTDNRTKTFSVQPKNGLGQGTYTATVTVSGINIDPQSFNVSFAVNNAPLSSIAVTTQPTKKTYIAGENFDPTGMVVTATYDDASTAAVTGYTVKDGNALTAGKTSVTIRYTEGGETKEATQDITVNAPSNPGSYVPTIQKPTIIVDDGAEGTLSFYGNKLTIKVADGYEITDVLVNGVSKGKVTELTGLKTGDKVEVKTEKKQEEPVEPTKEEIVAALKEQQMIARSKMTTSKSGRKAVLITWYNKNGEGVTFDGVEIYRSTKCDSGYGDEPIFVSRTGKYYSTAITEGTRYYYKVRGYVIIDGQKYYTDCSLKAIRTVK